MGGISAGYPIAQPSSIEWMKAQLQELRAGIEEAKRGRFILPDRLAANSLLVTNFNNAVENGWYFTAAGAANEPPVTGEYMLQVQRDLASGWVWQTATKYKTAGAGDTQTWKRAFGAGWSAWFRIRDSESEITTLIQGLRDGLVPIAPSSIAVSGSGSSASQTASGYVTMTSCATVTFNNVFSAGFDFYKLKFWTNNTPSQYLYLRYTNSGTATSASTFDGGIWYNQSGTLVGGTPVTAGPDAVVGVMQGLGASSELDFDLPFGTSGAPMMRGRFNYAATDMLTRFFWNAAVSFDGVRIASASGGLFTGKARWYGYSL